MKLILLAAAASLLAACATAPISGQQSRSEYLWDLHKSSLDNFNNWRLNARIAVTTADDGGTVQMNWRQQASDFDVRFSAAFGQGATRLTQSGNTARLVDAGGETTVGTDAEGLLNARLGWRVPIAQLREWLIGRPGDTSDFSIDSSGRLETAHLHGWTVKFQRYDTDNYPILPVKLALFSDEVRVRVVVDGWSHLRDANPSKRIKIPSLTPAGE